MGSYAICGNATNTASSTLPIATVIGNTTVRAKIFYVNMGSDGTPADNAGKFVFQRCTTAGTPGSSITPQPLDPADPATAQSTSGLAVFSVGPTLTANANVLQWAQNMKNTKDWYATPGKEIVIPATANNGIAILPTVTTTAFNCVFTIHFEE